MDVNQALKILDNVCSIAVMSRADHQAALQALKILEEALKPKEKPEQPLA